MNSEKPIIRLGVRIQALSQQSVGSEQAEVFRCSPADYSFRDDPGRQRCQQDAVAVMRRRRQQPFVTRHVADNRQTAGGKRPQAGPMLGDGLICQKRSDLDSSIGKLSAARRLSRRCQNRRPLPSHPSGYGHPPEAPNNLAGCRRYAETIA